jgi:hypothetical protein
MDEDDGGSLNLLLFSWEIEHIQAQVIEFYLVLLLNFNLLIFIGFLLVIGFWGSNLILIMVLLFKQFFFYNKVSFYDELLNFTDFSSFLSLLFFSYIFFFFFIDFFFLASSFFLPFLFNLFFPYQYRDQIWTKSFEEIWNWIFVINKIGGLHYTARYANFFSNIKKGCSGDTNIFKEAKKIWDTSHWLLWVQ